MMLRTADSDRLYFTRARGPADPYETAVARAAAARGLDVRDPLQRMQAAQAAVAANPALAHCRATRARLAASATLPPSWPPPPRTVPTVGAVAPWASGGGENAGRDAVSRGEKARRYEAMLADLLRGAGLKRADAARWDARERALYLRILADLAVAHPDLIAAVSGAGA